MTATEFLVWVSIVGGLIVILTSFYAGGRWFVTHAVSEWKEWKKYKDRVDAMHSSPDPINERERMAKLRRTAQDLVRQIQERR